MQPIISIIFFVLVFSVPTLSVKGETMSSATKWERMRLGVVLLRTELPLGYSGQASYERARKRGQGGHSFWPGARTFIPWGCQRYRSRNKVHHDQVPQILLERNTRNV